MSDIILKSTEAGDVLDAKLRLGNGDLPLHVTRIVTGAGTSPEPLKLRAVVDERQEFTILSREREGSRAVFRTRMDNRDVTRGYSIMQHGVYAMDPDEGEILYRISQFTMPNWMPALSERPTTFTPTFNFVVGNASVVSFHVEPDSWMEHVAQTVASGPGVHGIRFSGGTLQVRDGDGWVDVAGCTPPDGQRLDGMQRQIDKIMYLLDAIMDRLDMEAPANPGTPGLYRFAPGGLRKDGAANAASVKLASDGSVHRTVLRLRQNP